MIEEGKVVKGGVNKRPTSKRPPPPVGQGCKVISKIEADGTLDKLRATVQTLIEKEIATALVIELDHKPTEEETIACLNRKVSREYTDYFWNRTPLIRVHKMTSLDSAANLRIERLWMKE
jgi:hypothetical protein